MKLNTTPVLVTPEIASQWLARNKVWRKLRRNYVLQLAECMKAGRFYDIGHIMKFDSEGYLVDGQHRLAAIVETGIPFSMFTFHGVEHQHMHLLDSGIRRNPSPYMQARKLNEAAAIHD